MYTTALQLYKYGNLFAFDRFSIIDIVFYSTILLFVKKTVTMYFCYTITIEVCK